MWVSLLRGSSIFSLRMTDDGRILFRESVSSLTKECLGYAGPLSAKPSHCFLRFTLLSSVPCTANRLISRTGLSFRTLLVAAVQFHQVPERPSGRRLRASQFLAIAWRANSQRWLPTG